MAPETRLSRNRAARRVALAAMALVLLAAAGLRLAGLPDPPPGLHYDEAANIIMAREIAYRGALPVHINAFEGREVVYFYLSALAMRLLGDGEFALRLAAAFCGIVAVAATYPAARHWFRSRVVGALAAALLAVSLWNVIHSRLALESITVATVQAAALALWGWALRRARWGRLMAAAGAAAGLALYTYYSARAFPLVIAAGWAVLLLVADDRRVRLRQLVVFGVAALLVITPLVVYFVAHPDEALGRIGQLGPWGTVGEAPLSFAEAALRTAGMFFVKGDPQIRWNLPDRPIFDPVAGALMVAGLAVSVWRLARRGDPVARTGYALLIVNLVVMSIPSALAVRGLPPSFVRSVGLIPLLFVLPAIGAEALARALPVRWRRPALWGAVAAVIVAGGLHARYLYFDVWGPRADLYFVLEGDLEAAGHWLNEAALPDEALFVASKFYQHPTMAATADDYDRVRWLMARDVLILPAVDQAARYVFPRSAPAGDWAALLEPGRLAELPPAPDGHAAFEAFRFAAGDAPTLAPALPLEAYFGGVVALRGADVYPSARDYAEATLYWEVLAAPARDMRLTLDLRDAWGLPWAKDHVFVGDATTWQPGEWVITRVHVRVPPGTPPLDNYVLRAGWVEAETGALVPALDAQGRYVSTAAAVPGVSVGRPHAAPDQLPIQASQPVQAAEGVRLLGWNRETLSARPGDSVFLTLYWEADATTVHSDVFVRIHAVDAEGAGRLLWEGAPVHDTYPAREWLPNEIVADRYAGALPHDLPPGEYALTLRIKDQDGGGVAVDLGPLTVEEVARTFTAPPFDERVDALFGNAASRGDAIRLLGVTVDPRTAQPGAVVNVELVWQAEAEIEQSYTVFVHLYNPDGTIRTQQDHPPVDGAYPTNLWAPGEVVVDRYALALPPDTPPGAYTLGVGFYLQEGGARLPVGDTDWLDLGTVLVAE